MITRKTVFILGAGASNPYGFPTGAGLTTAIYGMHTPPPEILQYLNVEINSPKLVDSMWPQFHDDFRHADHRSLDAFIQDRPDYAGIGKALLAYELLRCEQPQQIADKMPGRWYSALMELLTPFGKAEPRDYMANAVTFVTFNYDRSLEYFLSRVFRARFPHRPDDVRHLLSHIPIIHVYGSLGDLDPTSAAYQPYSGDTSPAAIAIAAANIQLSSTVANPASGVGRIHQHLQEAEQVLCLGFGFDRTNVERLELAKNLQPGAVARATCSGMTAAAQERTKSLLPSLQLADEREECSKFLQIYASDIVAAEKPRTSLPMPIAFPTTSPFDV